MGTGRRQNRKEYEATPLEERAAINKKVRDGGSITPELHSVMSKLLEKDLLQLHEFTEVVAASFDGCWKIVLSDDEVLSADYLICASGTSVDILTDPLLGDLQKTHPVNIAVYLSRASGVGWWVTQTLGPFSAVSKRMRANEG